MIVQGGIMEKRHSASRPSLPCVFSLLAILAAAQAACAQSASIADQPALKDLFSGDFSIGCLLSYRHIGFPSDPKVMGSSAVVAPRGGELIARHMNCMSPGNNMKPMYTVDVAASAAACAESAKDQSKSAYAETHPIVRFNPDLIAQLDWAKRKGFAFRGHTIVWHSQTPPELFREGYDANAALVSKMVMAARLENYVNELFRLMHESWPGMMIAIDVVNEAVTDSGSIRIQGNDWYSVFGDDSYVALAFALARRASVKQGEGQAKLYYNDYNTHIKSKADGIARLCGPIFKAGNLDGIGMQEHDSLRSPTVEEWIASYDAFFPVCSEMSVTEFDVASGEKDPRKAVLDAQANQYAALFMAFVQRSARSGRGKIVNVSKDGLNDEFTFKTNQSSSLWYADYSAKPSFEAVAGIGRSYAQLLGMIARAASLPENDKIAKAAEKARAVMDANYSAEKSAATALSRAATDLKAAFEANSK
jgi:GH35 family endo-1,4-beta-xylanase